MHFKGFNALGPEQQAALIQAFGKQFAEEAQQTIVWVEELADLTMRLEHGVSGSDVHLYWVRLHEFVTRIHDRFVKSPEFSPKNAVQHNIAAISARLAGLCAAARARFSDDELIYIDVQRHRSAHVHQHKFHPATMQTKNGVAIKATVLIAAIGYEITLVEMEASLGRVEAAAGPTPSAVAKVLAAKSRNAVQSFCDALVAKYDVFAGVETS